MGDRCGHLIETGQMKIREERNSEEVPVERDKEESELEEGRSVGRKFRPTGSEQRDSVQLLGPSCCSKEAGSWVPTVVLMVPENWGGVRIWKIPAGNRQTVDHYSHV